MFQTKTRAQQIELKIFSVDSTWQEIHHFNQLTDVWQFIREKQNSFRKKGYLACSVDSYAVRDSLVKAWFYTGQKYKWTKIDFSNIPTALWNQLNINQKKWVNTAISPPKLARLFEKILQYCDNNGYPFATAYLDSFQNGNGGLKARFELNTGKLQKIDKIILKGNVAISLPYIENYLGIHQGDLYNESRLLKIRKRLKELLFLAESRPWRMEFAIDKNKLFLYLKAKKANQINGLLGLQPNTLETGKFLLTADFLLRLHNSLGYGETIEATYKNLQYKSPQFHTHVIAPYVLKSMFGIEGSFDLYKKDTTYRKTTFEIGLRYQFNAEGFINIFFQSSSNRLITPDTQFARINHKLPENVDVKKHGLGLSLSFNRTDNKLNPHNGWLANFTISGYERNIIPSDAILNIRDTSNFDFNSLYRQANSNEYQFHFQALAAWYFPIYRVITGKINYRGGYIYGEKLFQNELYQIGGFNSLRGFDENGFYANQFHVVGLEVHFNFGKNRYFYLFNDNAFVQTDFVGFSKDDFPVSFGLGLSMENKTGLFNIALGIGKHEHTPFQFRNAKIHFGYAAYF